MEEDIPEDISSTFSAEGSSDMEQEPTNVQFSEGEYSSLEVSSFFPDDISSLSSENDSPDKKQELSDIQLSNSDQFQGQDTKLMSDKFSEDLPMIQTPKNCSCEKQKSTYSMYSKSNCSVCKTYKRLARESTSSETENSSSERENSSSERENSSSERENSSSERENSSSERKNSSSERESNSSETESKSLEAESKSLEAESSLSDDDFHTVEHNCQPSAEDFSSPFKELKVADDQSCNIHSVNLEKNYDSTNNQSFVNNGNYFLTNPVSLQSGISSPKENHSSVDIQSLGINSVYSSDGAHNIPQAESHENGYGSGITNRKRSYSKTETPEKISLPDASLYKRSLFDRKSKEADHSSTTELSSYRLRNLTDSDSSETDPSDPVLNRMMNLSETDAPKNDYSLPSYSLNTSCNLSESSDSDDASLTDPSLNSKDNLPNKESSARNE